MVSAIIITAVLFTIFFKGTVSVLVSLLARKVLEAGTGVYPSLNPYKFQTGAGTKADSGGEVGQWGVRFPRTRFMSGR